MLQPTFSSGETRRSWIVALAALLIMAIAFGAPWITLVALKDIAAEVRGERSIPAFASALMWMGSGVGGILMGRIAERIGIRFTVIFGAAMVALGLALSSWGPTLPLYVGHGLFMGLIGIGGINAPFYVYVSRWFDRRRGSALALISSGAYLAGALWPPVFAQLIAYAGWRQAMLYYAGFELLVIVPAAVLVLAPPPQQPRHPRKHEASLAKSVLGWPPNLIFALQMAAILPAAFQWRCRKHTWWRSAAISESTPRTARPWCRFCWALRSLAVSSGAWFRIVSAVSTPCSPGRSARRLEWWPFC
jgi:MFS family permease